MSTTIFLRFESEAAARALFLAYGYAPGADDQGNPVWESDGVLEYLGQRFDYHVVGPQGVIYKATGSATIVDGAEVAEMAPIPGYHVNILWHGPEALIPDFGAARVFPLTPECVFGP